MGILIHNNIVYGSTPPVDGNLSNTSENPVQNKVITEGLELKINKEDIVECTRARYESLDESKLTDNKLYFITDHTYNYNDDITPPIVYGYHIKPNVTDSSDAVEYIDRDKNVINDLTPAHMDFANDTFDYGSWEHAFFMPRPCMVNCDIGVDYYLDPNDYSKKIDESPSDIANASYNGNAMMEWGKLWFKYEAGETDGEGYFWVSDKQIDNDFHCWCNINSINREVDHFYTAIYDGTRRGTSSANKLRSLSGNLLDETPLTNINADVTAAERNNLSAIRKEWYISTFSDRLLINSLLVLIGKSLDTQSVFGMGLTAGDETAKKAYRTGTFDNKGLFYGTTSTSQGVKVFGMENWWGCVHKRIAGCVAVDNGATPKIKLTYGNADGSTATSYNFTGEGYIDTGITLPTNTTEKYITTMKYYSWGYFPNAYDSNINNSPYKDYFIGSTGSTGENSTKVLVCGGCTDKNVPSTASGAFTTHVKRDVSSTWWGFGAMLSYKPIN